MAKSAHAVENAATFHGSIDGIMAVLLLVGGVVFAGYLVREDVVVDPNSPDFNPLVLIPVVLGFFGLYLLVKAIRARMRARRFGVSRLELETRAVSLGKTLRGRLLISVPVAPSGPYRFRLRNIETVRSRSTGSTHQLTEYIRAEASIRVESSAAEPDGAIPFALAVPTEGVFAGDRAVKGQVCWMLDVSAPCRGIDYTAVFGVDVRRS